MKVELLVVFGLSGEVKIDSEILGEEGEQVLMYDMAAFS